MLGEQDGRTRGMCGRVGAGDDSRVTAMARLLGGVDAVLSEPGGAMSAAVGAACLSRSESGSVAASWSATPLPDALPADAAAVAERYDAFTLEVSQDAARLHGGISGAVPVYVDDAGSASGLHFCSRLEPLARTRGGGLRPDWTAWAHILAAGGPLEGRTTFAGIRRLQPWSRVHVRPGTVSTVDAGGWPWLDVAGTESGSLDAVRDALVAAVARLRSRSPLTSLLSGGWDSRILATLGAHAVSAADATTEPLAAWTTSSDTGTVLEELVAAKVAAHLHVSHTIVPPRWDRFEADVEHFARAVDHQTSFHIWLVPLAERLAGSTATVLDGLGGGLFLGGAFPDDDTGRPVLDQRFDRLARYLRDAARILHPRVVAQIRERTRESFENVAKPLMDHRFGATFTAYLTRTLPGISLAPYGLVAAAAPVATPFLDNEVVRAALAIPPDQHADGRLYPELLRPLDSHLAGMPTALELSPPERGHPRRVSSAQAAAHFQALLTRDPVRRLLAPELAAADLDVWRKLLNYTRPQHLIRGLAMLSLWLERYADVLDGTGVDGLLGEA